LVEITACNLCGRFDLVATSKRLLDLSNCETAYPIMLRDLLFQLVEMMDSSLNTEIIIPKGY